MRPEDTHARDRPWHLDKAGGGGRRVKPLRVNEAQVEDLTGGEVEEDGLTRTKMYQVQGHRADG